MGSLDLNIVLVAGLGIQVGVDIIAQIQFGQFFLQSVFLDHDTLFFGFLCFLWALWSKHVTSLTWAPGGLSDVYIDDAVFRLGVIMMKWCDDDGVMWRWCDAQVCDVTSGSDFNLWDWRISDMGHSQRHIHCLAQLHWIKAKANINNIVKNY